MMLAAAAGLATGLVHVLSGPDHLAAVAPLAVETSADRTGAVPARSWLTGLRWGLGHSAGVLLIGVLLLLFRERLPVDLISSYSERLVGAALVLVGVWGVWTAMRMGGRTRAHTHAPAGASFAMGTLHGLAGSSHVFGILPALAFATRSDALSYLGGFGVGAVCGMTMFAAAVGLVSSRLDGRRAGASRGFLYGSSAAAVIVGGVWLVG